MKKYLFLAVSFLSLTAFAQSEITAGKNPDVEVSSKMKYEIGTEIQALKVISANDESLVGKPIVCRVVETRRSNMTGQEGRLVLRPLFIQADGKQVDLMHDDIYLRGKNRCNIKFWVPIALWAGGGAKMPKNAKYTLYIK
ncbi:hypothetical protein [uncultured Prevotella sp.]|uniref:hypothetical protein n=1 Tax=uncultured Prevotella sp. TaxID=159272 RepID=UPI00258273E5|nr:hypothetical protein [uncultured Prevotella sp.]